MGAANTGSGRRESYQSIPMPRMTNTYMLAGDDAPEDILRSVKRGLYAVNFGGGQVDITNGKFVFSASEAYLIEDGKITAPVRDATLIGNGPEALKYVSMVGHDLKLDEGIGTCGKDGQIRPRRRRHAHHQAGQDDRRRHGKIGSNPPAFSERRTVFQPLNRRLEPQFRLQSWLQASRPSPEAIRRLSEIPRDAASMNPHPAQTVNPCLNACIGSIEAARRAGTRHSRQRRQHQQARYRGQRRGIRRAHIEEQLRIRRVRARWRSPCLIAAPIAPAMRAAVKTSSRTSRRFAPSAMRMPTSCVRCSTRYAITP